MVCSLQPCRNAVGAHVHIHVHRSDSDNLVQSFNDPTDFLRGCATDHLSYTFDWERSDLTDLDPGLFGKLLGMQFKRKRKAGALRLTRESNGNHGARAFIEDVVAEDQDWAQACLLLPAYRIQVGPADLTPQYSGHVFQSG